MEQYHQDESLGGNTFLSGRWCKANYILRTRNCQVHCTITPIFLYLITPLSRAYNMGYTVPSTKTRTVILACRYVLYCPWGQVNRMPPAPSSSDEVHLGVTVIGITLMHNNQNFRLPSKILIGGPPQEEKFLTYLAEKWNLFTLYLFFTLSVSVIFLFNHQQYLYGKTGLPLLRFVRSCGQCLVSSHHANYLSCSRISF